MRMLRTGDLAPAARGMANAKLPTGTAAVATSRTFRPPSSIVVIGLPCVARVARAVPVPCAP
jgi:hypothetical protein